MDKSPRPKKKQKSSTRKIDPTIAVAIIGLCGTVVTALLASPWLVPWINQYINAPAIATTETIVPASPTFINIASATAIPATPTFSPTLIGQDWKSIMSLRFAPIPNCYASQQLLPPSMNPAENFDVAKTQIAQAVQSEENRYWPIVGDASIYLDISSLATNQEGIKISNKLHLDVTSQNNLPESVNVLDFAACGGEGHIRTFSTINLSNEFDTYSLDSVFSEFEFFQLAPGEIESFSLPLECKAIGVYSVKVNVSYVYSAYSGVTDSDQTFELLCPQIFTVWYFSPRIEQFIFSETYRWNGGGYEKEP